MNKNLTTRAVIYARSAADDQFGLDAQITACHNFCINKGYAISNVYQDAGKLFHPVAECPAYEQLLADAEKGLFDVVVIDEIDNIVYNQEDYYSFKKKMMELGITCEFVTIRTDNSPEGQLAESTLVYFAAYKAIKSHMRP